MDISKEFLISAISRQSAHADINSILSWVREQNQRVEVKIERIGFNKMNHWYINPLNGSIQHESGRFFSVDGIRVITNWGEIPTWEQPIINQKEIGYLGFIAKRIEGILHFLVQAKIEPGNVNHVQLSPTIQATRSNYTQVHGGSKPLYLDYFVNAKPRNVLLDQLQSEQGARFLMKRNRNMIILVDEEIPTYDNYIWLTLRQIKELMQYDNLVNMDTRTVLSGIQYYNFDKGPLDIYEFLLNYDNHTNIANDCLRSAICSAGGINQIKDIIHFLTKIKSQYELSIDIIPLAEVMQWSVSCDEISRDDGKYFKVIGVDVEISNREIISWQQPMIQPCHPGVCAFVCKKINGILHFIIQAKLECGNRDIVELAPTVQCLLGGYTLAGGQSLPFLDYVLNAPNSRVLFDSLQSEEGGRFYQEQNRNMVIIAEDDFSEKIPDNFIWMTLYQLAYFNRFNNYLNIQARSLLAAIKFI
jgi:oxidase EvaA